MHEEAMLFDVPNSSSDEEERHENQQNNASRHNCDTKHAFKEVNSFAARFLDPFWFEDVDSAVAKHEYHERKKVLLCKANNAFMCQDFQEVLQLCEEARTLIHQKGETREWAETEARAAFALNNLDLALFAAQKRANLDRGYEWVGRKLYAEVCMKAERFEDALGAFQLCITAQRTNFKNWCALSTCYEKLSSVGRTTQQSQIMYNYVLQSLVRGIAWLKFMTMNSSGFVHDQHIRDQQPLLEKLERHRPDFAGMTCEMAMSLLHQELQKMGVEFRDETKNTGRDYLEIVPPCGLSVDRTLFERDWFCTKRRLPDEVSSEAELIPEPDLPEKGPRTGN